MAVVVIKDELDIESYIKTVVAGIPDIKAVEFVDVAPEELNDFVKSYFQNKYKGTVLFWGNYEEKLSTKQALSWSTPQLQATILSKYEKNRPDTIMAVRTATKKLMLKFIHKIKADQEDTYNAAAGKGDNGKHWSFKLHNDMIFPIGDMGGATVRGWSIDFEIGFPVTEVV